MGLLLLAALQFAPERLHLGQHGIDATLELVRSAGAHALGERLEQLQALIEVRQRRLARVGGDAALARADA